MPKASMMIRLPLSSNRCGSSAACRNEPIQSRGMNNVSGLPTLYLSRMRLKPSRGVSETQLVSSSIIGSPDPPVYGPAMNHMAKNSVAMSTMESQGLPTMKGKRRVLRQFVWVFLST